jgi:hypothetical protein
MEQGRNVESLRPASVPGSERSSPHLPPFGPDGPLPEVVAALQARPRFAAACRAAASE